MNDLRGWLLRLPAFFQGCLVIGIESGEHLGFRSSSYDDHVVLASVPSLVDVDAESRVFPRWLVNHEVTPSPSFGQAHRLQKLDGNHAVLRLLTSDLFPSLDRAVHIDGLLNNVFFLAPRSAQV